MRDRHVRAGPDRRWSMLFGIPVAVWGVAFYVATFILALAGTLPAYAEARPLSWALLAVTGWGLVFSSYLTALELFVIHAILRVLRSSAILVAIMCGVAIAEVARPNRARESRGTESRK